MLELKSKEVKKAKELLDDHLDSLDSGASYDQDNN